MRFIENGPNIPDDLLYAQDEGQVVFFYGAGVSMAKANLPSFSELAEKVMNELGVTGDDKARTLFATLKQLDSNPHTRGQISADHIFNSLKRSYNHKDINRAVAKSLLPGRNPDLSAHKTTLKLARLQTGEVRLITTNFDLLYERCDKTIASVTRANLPRLEFSNNDWGIVHLHGKVTTDYTGPDSDGFVLSSSEFGDAYLAQGWARDFVKSVLEKFTAVFIGYGADDPPVRYLLEGLQQGNGPKHKIYAFQSGPNEEAVAQWDEKGVDAIVYEVTEAHGHKALWDTLEAWGVRAKNPVAWKKKILSKGRKNPTKLHPHERGMVAHIVKSTSGARAFEQESPPMTAEWLCVFDPSIRLRKAEREYLRSGEGEIIDPYQLYSLDDDPPPSGRNEDFQPPPSQPWDAFKLNAIDYDQVRDEHLSSISGHWASNIPRLPDRLSYLANWIKKVSNQRITVWWAGQQIGLHPEILKSIKFGMTHEKDRQMSNSIKEVWNKVFEVSRYDARDEYSEYDLQDHIKTSGWSQFSLREYAKASAPFLKREMLYGNSIPRDNRRKLDRYAHINIDVDFPKGIYELDIPDDYLEAVISIFRGNLEHAIELESDYSGWLDLCAIERDVDAEGQEFARSYGLSGYVLYFVSLYRRLAKRDKEKAKAEFIRWRKDDEVFSRLRVWASGLMGIVSGDEFASEVLSLSRNAFWSFKGDRDLLLALKNQWSEISSKDRKNIENKILRGPSRYRNVPKDEFEAISAHHVLNRFHWLHNQGCTLSFELEELTKTLSKLAPEWKPEYANTAAQSHDGGGGPVKTDTDWSSLKFVPLSKIITKAKESKRRDHGSLTEYAPFAGLCDEAPSRALGALSRELKDGNFPEQFWKTYLSRESRKKDSYRIKLLTGGRLAQIPSVNFQEIILTASCWFEDAGPELRKENPKLFESVWSKFIETIQEHEKASKSALVRKEEREVDWAGKAINSASGNLAELLMTDPAIDNLKPKKGFPKSWLAKADELLQLPEDAHRFVMVILAFNLSWLFHIDPKWTENRLIKVIENENGDEDDQNAVWAGFMWGAKIPNQSLYVRLKPQFLKKAIERSSERKRNVEVLSGLLLAGWGSKDDKTRKRFINDSELRAVLLDAGDDFRGHILWHLKRWSNDKQNKWDQEILLFLRNVWPKHKKIRTKNISSTLCDIALSQEDKFPEVSREVSQLVSKIDNEHIFIPQVRKSSDIATKYPKELLILLYAVLPDRPENWPYGASDLLKEIEMSEPKLQRDPMLIELKSRLNFL